MAVWEGMVINGGMGKHGEAQDDDIKESPRACRGRSL